MSGCNIKNHGQILLGNKPPTCGGQGSLLGAWDVLKRRGSERIIRNLWMTSDMIPQAWVPFCGDVDAQIDTYSSLFWETNVKYTYFPSFYTYYFESKYLQKSFQILLCHKNKIVVRICGVLTRQKSAYTTVACFRTCTLTFWSNRSYRTERDLQWRARDMPCKLFEAVRFQSNYDQ